MTPHRLVPVEHLQAVIGFIFRRFGAPFPAPEDELPNTVVAGVRAIEAAIAEQPAVGSGAVARAKALVWAEDGDDFRCEAWGFHIMAPATSEDDSWSACWGDDSQDFATLDEAKAYFDDLAQSHVAEVAEATPTPPHAWMDIATAPRDGTEIWAFNGEQGRMDWIAGDEYALWVWSDELLREVDAHPEQPTHWMHLPSKPGNPTAPAPASPLVRGLERIVARIDKLDWRDKSHVCDYGKACEAVREMASRALLEQQAQP